MPFQPGAVCCCRSFERYGRHDVDCPRRASPQRVVRLTASGEREAFLDALDRIAARPPR